MSNELTHLDLFSGIGGFALAAKRQGFRTLAFSEIDPYACRVLARQFPGVPNLGNVRIGKSFAGLGPVTVCTGGYPFQPFSFCGKRAGSADDRHLWPAMRDVIAAVRPAWVIAENVLGHVTMGLDAVLADLEGIGYASQPFVIPACAVDARHLRNRVWIVANSSGGRCSPAGCRQDEQPGRTEIKCSGEVVADTDCKRQQQPQRGEQKERGWIGYGGADVPNCEQQRLEGKQQARAAARAIDRSGNGCDFSQWLPESGVCRVAHGITNRAHRLRGLGNAIVPQAVEPFFHWIRQIEEG